MFRENRLRKIADRLRQLAMDLRVFSQIRMMVPETEFVMNQIIRLLEKGWDQTRIRKELVSDLGIVEPMVFDKAWKEAWKYFKRKEMAYQSLRDIWWKRARRLF